MSCFTGPCFQSNVVQWFYDWQGLIGSILALFAAILGAGLLWAQMQAERARESNRLERRSVAARATLSHILSQMIAYLEFSMDWMSVSHPELLKGHALSNPPPFSEAIVQALEKMIEATNLDRAAKVCIEILSDLQTFNARLQSVSRSSRRTDQIQIGLDRDVENCMLQAAEIHHRVGTLFPFARNAQEEVPENLSGTSVFGSLHGLGCNELAFHSVYQRANEIDRQKADPAAAAKTPEPSEASGA